MKIFILLSAFFVNTSPLSQPLVRVLFLTDSIDRFFLLAVCERYHGEGANWGGIDFVTSNGNHADSWGSVDFGIKNKIFEHIPTSFKNNRITNWSDLSCLLSTQRLHLLSLHLFGSGESPPYHLGMCSKAKEFNGPYCNTRDRIDRAFSVIHERIGKIDVIFFHTMLWDLAHKNKILSEEVWRRYITNIEARLQQIRRLEPNGSIFLKITPLSNRSEQQPTTQHINNESYETYRNQEMCLYMIGHVLITLLMTLTAIIFIQRNICS